MSAAFVPTFSVVRLRVRIGGVGVTISIGGLRRGRSRLLHEDWGGDEPFL